MKILGLVLLMLGLVLIGWTLYTSYNIFTGGGEAPEIFTPLEEETILPPEEIPEELAEEMEESQLMQSFFIDKQLLPETLNLLIWGFLAFILIFGGGQIAGLGIRLMK